jgi:hypothetical protein
VGSNPTSSATKPQTLLGLETIANLSGERSLYPNLSQSANCVPQRSAKPLGSASTNKATVCETVVSAVGDYFRVARHPTRTATDHCSTSCCLSS